MRKSLPKHVTGCDQRVDVHDSKHGDRQHFRHCYTVDIIVGTVICFVLQITYRPHQFHYTSLCTIHTIMY